jgi:serine phosphatase RsbU (regulator of sigma subunit)
MIRIGIIKKQKKELEIQVLDRTSEIMAQTEEILAQREKLEELLNDVQDSIRAVEEIQKFLLPSLETIQEYLPESFILNKPKDVVSGDFYWFGVKDNKVILATVDCVGHGVAGAFMSVNGHHLLNQAIVSSDKLIASEILDKLHNGLIEVLHLKSDENSNSVGMDVGLCIIDYKSDRIQFAGANNPLYLIRNGNLTEIKGNKFQIGSNIKNRSGKFTNHEFEVVKGDIIYLFSDGYADQIGGSGGNEKFMYPRFRELLMRISNEQMRNQEKILDNSINEWKGNQSQLDDILVIGFKC